MTTIHGIDNRGTDKVPFGYVYVNGTRVGFSHDDTGKLTIWGSRPEGYWPYPVASEFEAARDALIQAGFNMDGDK